MENYRNDGDRPDHDDASRKRLNSPPEILAGVSEAFYREVSALQSAKTPATELVQALDGLAERVDRQLTNPYRGRRVILSLPLPQSELALTQVLIDLHSHLAQGYRSVPLRLPGTQPDTEFELVVRAASGAMRHLTRTLLYTYEGYRAAPERTWRDVHTIYDRIRRLQLQNSPAPRTSYTLAHVYKQSLLLGLSGPYELPFGVITSIVAHLPAWSEHAQLTTKLSRGAERCVFMIDPTLDKPAVPLLSHAVAPQFGEHLFFDTSDLGCFLEAQAEALTKAFHWDKDNPQHNFFQLQRLDMLRSLVRRWKTHRIRSSRRRRCASYCEVVFGVQSVCRSVEGGAPRDSTRATPPNHWRVSDFSDHGFRLTLARFDARPIDVNELVALRLVEISPAWHIGLILWARTSGPEDLEIGVRTISRHARPVTVRSLSSTGGQRRQRYSALYLPATDRTGASLILPGGAWDPDRAFAMKDGEAEHRIEMKRLIMATPAFEWFEV